jgi:hypothetical protein
MHLLHMVYRACQRCAFADLTTALFLVRVCAILVIAKNLIGIVPVQETLGASHACTCTFRTGVRCQVIILSTRPILTKNRFSVQPQNIFCWWLKLVAPCDPNAAQIFVTITAFEALAERMPRIVSVNIS